MNLTMRPSTNEVGLQRGLDTRSSAKLHMPREEGDTKRELWPWWRTSLLEEPVAGIAVTHMFRFEFALIAWAVLVAIAWVFLAVFVDSDFNVLGVKDPGRTPRDHCIIVQWGYTTQQRLMSAKVAFMFGLYFVSFALAIGYGIGELRKHHYLDAKRCSHKDFCARCVGLPCLRGNAKVEYAIAGALRRGTGQEVLGVSICWDYQDANDDIQEMIDYDYEGLSVDTITASVSTRQGTALKRESTVELSMSWLTRLFLEWEKVLLAPAAQRVVKKQYEAHPADRSALKRGERELYSCGDDANMQATADAEEQVDRTKMVCDTLGRLRTTAEAYVLFNTEDARDLAIAKAAKLEGINYQYKDDDGETRTAKLMLLEEDNEPQSVNWANFGKKNIWINVLLGLLCILCALVVWCCCFYLPYAYSVMRADYAHGTDPNLFTRTMFGFIVVAGNALMYVVCAEVSDRIGFKTRSEREVCYMLLYCFACVFNVLLDLTCSYLMAYKTMVGMGMKTHNGEPLSEVQSFSRRFETYAMQKSLGGLLLDYSFPSTFLIPFLIEPLVVIYFPYKVMSLIVRTHPAIIGATADAYLASSPMDLSRYADVLLNLMLASLIFFFPGGYVLYMFVGLIVSHLFIYAYDRYRVLRCIPECDFATFDVEWWAQWLLCIPCGILLSCAVFKATCKDTDDCWHNRTAVVERCFMLFLLHIAVHTLCMVYVVPILGAKTKAEQKRHDKDYKMCSRQMPCSFFSANPIHCLRSQYIYDHHPPFRYYIPGKDHMMEKNEDIHQYYEVEERPDSEEYGLKLRRAVSGLKDASRNLQQASHNVFDRFDFFFSHHSEDPEHKQEPESVDSGTSKKA
jgi:hypothetical protein